MERIRDSGPKDNPRANNVFNLEDARRRSDILKVIGPEDEQQIIFPTKE